MESIEKEYKSKGTVSKRITFPLLFWDEFEKDCKDNYNDTYFLKIQSDHDFKKNFQNLAELLVRDILELKNDIHDLKLEVAELRTPNKEEKPERKTF